MADEHKSVSTRTKVRKAHVTLCVWRCRSTAPEPPCAPCCAGLPCCAVPCSSLLGLAPGTPKLAPSTPKLAPSTRELVPDTPELAPSTPKLAPGTPKLAPSTPELVPDTAELAPGAPEVARDASGLASSTADLAPDVPFPGLQTGLGSWVLGVTVCWSSLPCSCVEPPESAVKAGSAKGWLKVWLGGWASACVEGGCA